MQRIMKIRLLFVSLISMIFIIALILVYGYNYDLPRTGISRAVLGLVEHFVEEIGYVGIFVLMVAESAGIPIPSEIIMPFAGFLVYKGILNFWLVVFVGSLANLVGGLIAYYIGAQGREFLEKYGKYLLIQKHHLEWAERWFEKYGTIIVLLGRNMPVIRTYISFPAGISRMNVKVFAVYTFFGSIPWNILLTWIGIKLGENWGIVVDFFEKLDVIIVIVGLIAIVYLLKYEARVDNENI